MTARRTRAGQPLVAIGTVLGAWIALRIVMFEPFPIDGSPAWDPNPVKVTESIGANTHGSRPAIAIASERLQTLRKPHIEPAKALFRAPPLDQAVLVPPFDASIRQLTPDAPPPKVMIAPRTAAGHSLLWMAGMANLPLAPEVAAALESPVASSRRNPQAPRSRRWGADAWLLWRGGTSGVSAASLIAPVYGGSQTGAVLRYRLAPRAASRPEIYVRAVSSLSSRSDTQIASGFAVRPFASVPISAHGEVRVNAGSGAKDFRPAAFLAGSIDDVAMPAGVVARGYAQAGIVGGRDGTAFADGNLLAERAVVGPEEMSLSAGAGIWGGAQRDAARVDIGPSASVKFRIGDGTGRLSADYRLRIAGNAEPRRGAALTLSAGF